MSILQGSLAADNANILDDGNDYTATDVGQVGGADKVIDLAALGIDWEKSPMLAVQINVSARNGSGTLTIAVENGTAALAAVSATSSRVIPVNETGDYVFQFKPANRYVQTKYTIATGATCTIEKAFLSLIPQ